MLSGSKIVSFIRPILRRKLASFIETSLTGNTQMFEELYTDSALSLCADAALLPALLPKSLILKKL